MPEKYRESTLLWGTVLYNTAFAGVQLAIYINIGVGAFWGGLFTGLYLLGVNALWQLLFLIVMIVRLSGRGFFGAVASYLKDRRQTVKGEKFGLPEVAEQSLRGTAWPLLLVPLFLAFVVWGLAAFGESDFGALKLIVTSLLAGGGLGFLLARNYKIAPIPMGFGDGYDIW